MCDVQGKLVSIDRAPSYTHHSTSKCWSSQKMWIEVNNHIQG